MSAVVAKDNGRTEPESKMCLACLSDREGIWLLSVAQQRGRACLQRESKTSPRAQGRDCDYIWVQNEVKWSNGVMRQPFSPSGRTESKLLLRWNRKTEWKSLAWLLGGSHSRKQQGAPQDSPVPACCTIPWELRVSSPSNCGICHILK